MSVPSTSADFRLSSFEPLKDIAKKKCLGCGRMRMYFCYDCRKMMSNVPTPSVRLPALVDVVKHPKEKNSKSTAVHCALVANSQTRIFDVPHLEDYGDGTSSEGSTVLVFPSETATSIEDFVRTRGAIRRFVVLDCTWFQVGMMQRLPEIQSLPCVSLRSYRTAFWRPQHNQPETHLATIEAIYFALREYSQIKTAYNGEFDDLLYWFYFVREKVDEREAAYRKRKVEEEATKSEETPEGKRLEL